MDWTNDPAVQQREQTLHERNLTYHKVSKQKVAGKFLLGRVCWEELLEMNLNLNLLEDVTRPTLTGNIISESRNLLSDLMPLSSLLIPDQRHHLCHPRTLCVSERYFLGTKRNFCSMRGSINVSTTDVRADQPWALLHLSPVSACI